MGVFDIKSCNTSEKNRKLIQYIVIWCYLDGLAYKLWRSDISYYLYNGFFKESSFLR